MGASVTKRGAAPADATDTGDAFHDPLMIGIGITFALVALAIVLVTGLIHWGVEYRVPPWSSNSYPPPVVHRW